ncbi:L,D-transpeptidase [Marinobacter sp. CA1]|uniref:L,D-transpeptidase n=1 Tax=Marinobacter sp. CA1 TaxID=2817656 RepID=UPI001D08BB64|nr:L,D-transpeptidase [Marinobacter sp. CA1]UDL06728.1 L,D-transpeptidase [Marinobacter sp. CA1]
MPAQSQSRIIIDLQQQQLRLLDAPGGDRRFPVSTALNGAGERDGSGCTPRGEHYIRARIGQGMPENSVFVARRPTGEIYSADLADRHPRRDWILTRILWLCGREWGRNRGPGVDTFRRFIYIHGTPDREPMGVPLSHGCVRMRNADLMELFDLVAAGTAVTIR